MGGIGGRSDAAADAGRLTPVPVSVSLTPVPVSRASRGSAGRMAWAAAAAPSRWAERPASAESAGAAAGDPLRAHRQTAGWSH